jgi:hypothetical protein
MTVIYALYDTPEAAQKAVDGLRVTGVHDREITILSSEPLYNYEMGQRDHHTVMPWAAFLGGLIGFSAGIALTSLTQLDWPLVTGGMPIVTIWTNAIPIFELTMLGAVLATVVTFLVSAGLPGRMPEIYDPAVSEGKILVGVAQREDITSADLERTLQDGGEVKWIT